MASIGRLKINLGLNTDGLKSGLSRSQGLLNRSAGKFRVAAQAITAAMSVAVVGAISSAIGTIKEFDQATADLASVSGKTRLQLKPLIDSAKEIGARSAFSATQVLGLQQELAKLGFSGSEILQSAEAIGQFSIAVGTDAASAAAVGGAALRSFQIDASKAEDVVATLAVATTKSALDFERLSVALPYVGAVANTAGYSLQKTTAILGVLSDRGLAASTTGTSLRKIFIEVANSGKPLDASLKKIQNSTNKVKTATELFGQKAAAAAIIIAENTDKIDELKTSITDVNGELKTMTDKRLDTLNGQLTLTESAWKAFIFSIDSGEGPISKIGKLIATNLTGSLEKLTALNEGEVAASVLFNPFQSKKNLDKVFAQLKEFKTKSAKLDLSGILSLQAIKELEGIYKKLGIEDASQKAADYINKLKEQRLETKNTDKVQKDLNKSIEDTAVKTKDLKDVVKELALSVVGDNAKLMPDLVKNTLALKNEMDTLESAANLIDRIKSAGSANFSVQGLDQLPTMDLTGPLSGGGFDPTDLYDRMDESAKKSSEAVQKIRENAVQTMEVIVPLNGLITDLVESMADSLVNIFSGDGGAAQFFGNILGIVSDFGKQIGKQFIAVGTATLAMKRSFTNPYALIAAGSALVLLSTVLKKTLSKGIPSLAIGTDIVRNDGLAYLHKNEAVVPANVAKGGFSMGGGNRPINIYMDGRLMFSTLEDIGDQIARVGYG